MKHDRKWTAIRLMLIAQGLVSGQEYVPKLIDVHVHYNGEPGFLPQMLARMNQVDGFLFRWFMCRRGSASGTSISERISMSQSRLTSEPAPVKILTLTFIRTNP